LGHQLRKYVVIASRFAENVQCELFAKKNVISKDKVDFLEIEYYTHALFVCLSIKVKES
jgi:hypothetical protein